jgi:hypothetical protein
VVLIISLARAGDFDHNDLAWMVCASASEKQIPNQGYLALAIDIFVEERNPEILTCGAACSHLICIYVLATRRRQQAKPKSTGNGAIHPGHATVMVDLISADSRIIPDPTSSWHDGRSTCISSSGPKLTWRGSVDIMHFTQNDVGLSI